MPGVPVKYRETPGGAGRPRETPLGAGSTREVPGNPVRPLVLITLKESVRGLHECAPDGSSFNGPSAAGLPVLTPRTGIGYADLVCKDTDWPFRHV